MERCSHCGSLIKLGNITQFLEKVNTIIENDQLNVKSRSRPKTHKRYFLYKKMREAGMSLESIGKYFGRDHATVIHGIKMHEMFSQLKDIVYLNDTEEYDNLFQVHK